MFQELLESYEKTTLLFALRSYAGKIKKDHEVLQNSEPNELITAEALKNLTEAKMEYYREIITLHSKLSRCAGISILSEQPLGQKDE